jgi:hypothetical protein
MHQQTAECTGVRTFFSIEWEIDDISLEDAEVGWKLGEQAIVCQDLRHDSARTTLINNQ